jgi:hypothetical protein
VHHGVRALLEYRAHLVICWIVASPPLQLSPRKRTSEKQYWYALEVLPPAYQDGYGFLVGEPQDHARCEISKEVLPRFDAYVHKGKRYYVSIRALTKGVQKVGTDADSGQEGEMRTIQIGDKRYFWRDILKLRREQQKAERQPQPTLFELRVDARPTTQRTASDRYENPTLFEKGR